MTFGQVPLICTVYLNNICPYSYVLEVPKGYSVLQRGDVPIVIINTDTQVPMHILINIGTWVTRLILIEWE